MRPDFTRAAVAVVASNFRRLDAISGRVDWNVMQP
jgi:hypothetical protein